MAPESIQRTGRVERGPRGTGPVVTFDAEYCPGCDGRCGVGIGTARMRLPGTSKLPAGTPVVVTASPGALARCTVSIFGLPLLALGASAALGHFGAWSDWTVGVAALAAIGATVAVARWCRR